MIAQEVVCISDAHIAHCSPFRSRIAVPIWVPTNRFVITDCVYVIWQGVIPIPAPAIPRSLIGLGRPSLLGRSWGYVCGGCRAGSAHRIANAGLSATPRVRGLRPTRPPVQVGGGHRYSHTSPVNATNWYLEVRCFTLYSGKVIDLHRY